MSSPDTNYSLRTLFVLFLNATFLSREILQVNRGPSLTCSACFHLTRIGVFGLYAAATANHTRIQRRACMAVRILIADEDETMRHAMCTLLHTASSDWQI